MGESRASTSGFRCLISHSKAVFYIENVLLKFILAGRRGVGGG